MPALEAGIVLQEAHEFVSTRNGGEESRETKQKLIKHTLLKISTELKGLKQNGSRYAYEQDILVLNDDK